MALHQLKQLLIPVKDQIHKQTSDFYTTSAVLQIRHLHALLDNTSEFAFGEKRTGKSF